MFFNKRVRVSLLQQKLVATAIVTKKILPIYLPMIILFEDSVGP
jgi:hypothetical protein